MVKKLQYFLCAIIMVAVTGLSSAVGAENWVQFSKTHSPGFRIFYDTDSIKVDEKGESITFRLKSLNPQLAGMVQICNMEVNEKRIPHPQYPSYKVSTYYAAMLDKKVLDTSGNLIKQEGRESLGPVIGSNWDFLEEVAIYAGKHGLYPESKILNLNQYEEVVVDYQSERSKVAYFPQTIKKTPRGYEFDLWFQNAKYYPISYVYHCIMDNSGAVVAEETRAYIMWYFMKSEKQKTSVGNIAQSPKPKFREMYNYIKNNAR